VGEKSRGEFLAMTKHLVELIRRTSTDISEDVVAAIVRAGRREPVGSMGRSVLDQILVNIELAREEWVPVCQDTGTPIFYVDYPAAIATAPIRAAIVAAVREATKKYYLRPNSVETLSGTNTGDNVGVGHPSIHFDQWRRKSIRFRLMLKGGGSENVGAQYSLPDLSLSAGRDMAGVEKCVIDAVFKAQGKGCAPGVIGVGVGGDRGSSYILSKEQFFRKLDDQNPEATLRKMEGRLLRKLNSLGIGPMGLGGKTTVLGVKVGVANRIPASYFVSVSYTCWAYRRRTMTLEGNRAIYD
jgi:fumarate hydratase class I